MRAITRVILHCSATPDYPEPTKKFDLYGAADIDVWHKKKGWSGIGYHYVIRRTGVLETGRPIEQMGAHVKGENSDSIGVCYIGTKRPTAVQVNQILYLAELFHDAYDIVDEDWWGHYEFTNKKECPGINMDILRAAIRGVL